ncbi:MAG: ParB/RepB/Spo0J family partition protein [Planctomycetota bacterium]
MQKPQKRLGKGLDALIANTNQSSSDPATNTLEEPDNVSSMIGIDRIRTNPFQPRTVITPDQINALAESIKKTGVIQPIVVRQYDEDLFEIIVGERRWRACQMAGLNQIPAVIRDVDNHQMLEFSLIENIFREDLNPIDRASAYKRYCDEFDLTAEEVANRIGEDRSTVTNYMRLLDLPTEVKSWVIEGQLTMGHARCLLAIKSPSDLINTAQQAIDNLLSVRDLEKIVRQRIDARATATKNSNKTALTKRPQIRTLEEAFTRTLGTKVEIQEARRKGKGKIIIQYYTLDDFDRISQMLNVNIE